MRSTLDRPLRSAGLFAALLTIIAWASSALAASFSAVMFEQDPVFDPTDLLPLYRSDLGAPIDDALKQRLTTALIDHYRSKDYLPPAPAITNVHEVAGIVVIAMQEPHVARIRVNGQEQVSGDGLQRALHELQSIRPLRRADFGQWLVRVNRLGINVRGNLIRESAVSHRYIAQLQVLSHRWHGSVHLDNRAPEQLGRELAQLSIGYRSTHAWIGQPRLDVASAADPDLLRYFGISGVHQFDSRDDRLQWKHSRSTSSLPVDGRTVEVDYERERTELEYVVQHVRHAQRRAEVSLGLRSYDLKQDLDDGRRLRRDKIRAVRVEYSLKRSHGARHLHHWQIGVDKGINVLGASLWPQQDALGPEGDFLIASTDYRYRFRLNQRWQLSMDFQMQASEDRLPSSERFFIGGSRLGGAFDPATLSGDQGLGIRIGAERHFPVRLLNNAITAFAYYDQGYVWSHDDTRITDDASSLGIGVKTVYRGLSLRLEAAHPVRSPDTPNLLEDGTRLFFSLTQRF